MDPRPFRQVDVFSNRPGDGNPLAVVLDGSDLDEGQMRRFAAWTNLSETIFILPPSPEGLAGGADYRIRIFTPNTELPFAGHPTLGSCHAWLEAGNQPRHPSFIVQESSMGLVRIRREADQLAFEAPPVKRSEAQPALLALVTNSLGLRAHQVLASQMLDNGPVWMALLLDSAETLRQLRPDHTRLHDLGQRVGVAYVDPKKAHDTTRPGVLVRAFASPMGIPEDPVTGSLNASLAQWLMSEGLAPTAYQAAQGESLGRAGRLHIRRDAEGQVWIGGHSITCIEGQVRLPPRNN